MICKYELRCTNKDRNCGICKHNPNAKLRNCFNDRGFIPACEHGYDDCIHDPAGMLAEYDNSSWLKNRFTKEELIQMVEEGCHCEDGCEYDDECK